MNRFADKVVTVKPGEEQDWRVAIEGRSRALSFSTRQLALDFARSYAKLRWADTVWVYSATGVLEHAETIDFSLSGKA